MGKLFNIGGYSAYAIAVKNGFEGTEQEWIDRESSATAVQKSNECMQKMQDFQTTYNNMTGDINTAVENCNTATEAANAAKKGCVTATGNANTTISGITEFWGNDDEGFKKEMIDLKTQLQQVAAGAVIDTDARSGVETNASNITANTNEINAMKASISANAANIKDCSDSTANLQSEIDNIYTAKKVSGGVEETGVLQDKYLSLTTADKDIISQLTEHIRESKYQVGDTITFDVPETPISIAPTDNGTKTTLTCTIELGKPIADNVTGVEISGSLKYKFQGGTTLDTIDETGNNGKYTFEPILMKESGKVILVTTKSTAFSSTISKNGYCIAVVAPDPGYFSLTFTR